MAMGRRASLKVGALGVVSVLKGPRVAAQQTSTSTSIPPSILALTSMQGMVKPISREERQARIARAQQLMTEHKMDAIMLAGGTSLSYFTGIRWGNSERLLAAVIPAKGKAFCVCPSFEEERAREQLNRGPLEGADVLTWHEDESPYKQVAAGLKLLGHSAGVLGIEERTPWVFSEGIASAAPVYAWYRPPRLLPAAG